MADFDEKLNAILSDPDAMSQIMQLAQSLGGTSGQTAAASTPPAKDTTSNPSPGASAPELQMFARFLPLLQELSGQQNSNARTLLLALRPYLKPERQDKVERAIQLAHLIHTGKAYLTGRGNSNHV